jgi:hypothetical protein
MLIVIFLKSAAQTKPTVSVVGLGKKKKVWAILT